MSINTLLENPPSQSKPWCNLYVDTLTAYKGINMGDMGRLGEEFTETLRIRLGDGVDEVATTTATFRKLGKLVLLNVKPFSYTIPTSNSPIYYITVGSGYIPEKCRPQNNTILQCIVRDDRTVPHPITSGHYAPGAIYLGFAGTIGFYLQNSTIDNGEVINATAGNFPTGVETGIYEINVFYSL